VPDADILKGIAALGKLGIFAEPAGATAYAGLVRAVADGLVREYDPILVLNTGSGLKDVKAAMQAVPEAPVVKPDLESLKQALKGTM
jgi:threonine synthase